MAMSISSAIPNPYQISLPLRSPMTQERADIKSKAAVARDLLSSFDRDILPSEYRSDIVANLDQHSTRKFQQQPELTIQQDLEGSLLQWAVHNSQVFTAIHQLQSPIVLARCFHEKLSRRFKSIFTRYDVLVKKFEGSEQTNHDIRELVSSVDELAEKFHAVALAVHEDCMYPRDTGQSRTLSICLEALSNVCERSQDIFSALTTLQMESRSLFKSIFQIPPLEKSAAFIMLKDMDSYDPSIIAAHRTEVKKLLDLLRLYRAPPNLAIVCDRLLQRADNSQTQSVVQDVPSASHRENISEQTVSRASSTGNLPPVLPPVQSSIITSEPPAVSDPEPRAGSKRAAAPQGASRRGRKKTTK